MQALLAGVGEELLVDAVADASLQGAQLLGNIPMTCRMIVRPGARVGRGRRRGVPTVRAGRP